MQLAQPVTECPYCKGKSGFITNIVFKAKRLTGWAGDSEDTDSYQVASEANPKCADCFKSVRSLFKKQ